jgi:ankyrin repeat protein
MRLLLDKGADVNATGGEFGNALQAAVISGHIYIAQLLLEKGADVNATGGEHGNALIAASYLGHLSTVKLLLDRGANVNAYGNGKHSNALAAVRYSSTQSAFSGRDYGAVVELLLSRGAHDNIPPDTETRSDNK